VASVALALVEGSRINDFATWRALDAKFAKVAELLPRRATIAKATVVEKQIESVQ
jgi:hypothetical protein